MAAIRTLLNPLPIDNIDKSEDRSPPVQVPTPTTPTFSRDFSPALHARKKQKICKDAAVFNHGPVRGECRYAPYEYQDGELAAYHEHFEMYPMGQIADYPRHIPYNSEKKSFLNKTGRECLEVFQYRFKVPSDDTTYTMLWDYNIGLVRTTPLFKCCGYSKTTPAKMLNRNVGLREICHSITGGALVAQGYWMPYEAAKAVAATFCWSIRYALTPVFGIDFPGSCTPPESERFGDMLIDPDITRHCTEQAGLYRELELDERHSRASSGILSPPTPDTPTYPRHMKQLRSKALKIASSSGYCSETTDGSNYSLSPMSTPQPSYRTVWTAANTPRSIPHFDTNPPPLRDLLAGIQNKLGREKGEYSSSSSGRSSPALSPKSGRMEIDRTHDSGGGETPYATSIRHYASKENTPEQSSDEKAAYLLMNLRSCKRTSETAVKAGKRRAST